MAKRKINPNRIPIAADSFDIQKLALECTNSMVLEGWALVLGAFADFSEATTESLIGLWNSVNAYSSTVHKYADIEEELKKIEQIAGIKVPFERIPAGNIKTQGDLDRFVRKTRKYALYAAFAIIASPIIHQKILCEEDIALLFRKAYSMGEEVSLGKNGRVSMDEILETLEEEFRIRLYVENGQAKLLELTESEPQRKEA